MSDDLRPFHFNNLAFLLTLNLLLMAVEAPYSRGRSSIAPYPSATCASGSVGPNTLPGLMFLFRTYSQEATFMKPHPNAQRVGCAFPAFAANG